MKALFVIGWIVIVLFLIGEIRIGGLVEYCEAGFFLKAKIATFWFDVYPASKEKERAEKKKESPKKDNTKGGKLGLLLDLVPVIVEAVGALFRKIRVDALVLHLTWAAEDPASAAMGYGAANAALGTIYLPLRKVLRTKKEDICLDVDFERKEPVIYGKAVLTITIGQVIILCVRYGIRALAIWNERRKQQNEKTMKEAKQHE